MIYTTKQILAKVPHKMLKWLININYINHIGRNKYTLKCVLIENMDLDILQNDFKKYLSIKKEKMIEKCRQSSKKLWQNDEYRNKVTKAIKISTNSSECKNKKSESLKKSWTNERRKKHSIKIKQTMATEDSKKLRSEVTKQLWQNDKYRNKVISHVTETLNLESVKQKRSEKMKMLADTTDFKLKIATSIKKAYENPEYKQKLSNSIKKVWENSELRQRQSDVLKKVWENSKRKEQMLQNRCKAMKQNDSYGKSSWEDNTYKLLLTKFNENDIMRQYFDKERYPFNCDFYIKSLDLFIECHYGWTHGSMPFDKSSKDCQNQLKQWQEKAKNSMFYQNAIYQWTDLDVRKIQCLKMHNLNYRVFYNYKDFKNWCDKEA